MIASYGLEPHLRRGQYLLIAALTCASWLTGACSGGGPASPSAGDVTITIRATGVDPKQVQIKAWAHVTFVNMDVRPHSMASDPPPIHTDCPPINQVGYLNPGESRSTGTLTEPRTCGFHDHLNETDTTYMGKIVIVE
jgi:plastocyanin